MMFATVEVRWFYEGSLPEGVAAWYRALGPSPDEQPPRTDFYLHPTDAALNVKLREGKVEAKRRDAESIPAQFHAHVAGHVEHWCKWSFPLSDEATLPAADAPGWIPVRKHRWMRAYRVTEAGDVEEVAAEADTPRRCEVEVSRLEVGDHAWWGLCCEASGEAPSDTLHRTATHVFARGTPPTLSAEHSMGYPSWLLRTHPESRAR